ncbi:thioesterase II family protein [Pseudoalteromonas maricaloris]|uniref:thioesterase II family protein n=1 Tax=Pseudoalteromonas maricaloris TaxID=184924 RepID=UPI000299ECB7|nr:alpha/beta fold hydrolase [Pseudoalteromonas flavipulchra]
MSTPSIKLLCLPCAGASASMYLRWSRQLPSWIKLVPVELAGRGSRLAEAKVENYHEQVSAILQGYQHEMTGDYAFFGHSMGALLAYGVTLQLQQRNLPLPNALMLSACPAPQFIHPERYPEPNDRQALIAELRAQGGTPDMLFDNADLLEMTLEVLAADYRALRSFAPSSPSQITVPVTTFYGHDDLISVSEVLAWQQHARHPLSQQGFAGGHFYIHSAQASVLSALEQTLSRHNTSAASVVSSCE